MREASSHRDDVSVWGARPRPQDALVDGLRGVGRRDARATDRETPRACGGETLHGKSADGATTWFSEPVFLFLTQFRQAFKIRLQPALGRSK